MSDSKRDIAADRAMCEFLKIDRWLSVEARAEYGYGARIDVNLTHGDDMGVAEDDIFTVAKALPHYIDRCETQQRMLEAAIDWLLGVSRGLPIGHGVCPYPVYDNDHQSGKHCGKPEAKCRDCLRDYLDKKAKEGAK